MASDDIFLKKEVVLMEDTPMIQQTIKQLMEELNWDVKIADSAEDVVAYAKERQAAYYILDVNMGKDREQEGIKALQKIKKVNSDACVTILSAYPQYERLVKNVDPNVLFIEKTINLKEDIHKLVHRFVSKILEYREKCLIEQTEETRNQLNQLIIDDNRAAYEKLKSEKFDEYKNKYVAFVDGELVGVAHTEEESEELLKRLMTLPEFRNKSKFFTQVKKIENYEIIDFPSAYMFENF